MKSYRKDFFLNLIKLAARREDIEALRGILEFKYPGDRRIPGFAVQYYEKFIKGKSSVTPLTEDGLPQPLPNTIEELLNLLQTTETVKKKTKKEEFAESLKSKYPNVDLTNLNEDYLSWLNQRYIENKIKSGEIVHPIKEALETLKKFPSIQDKYKASAEFREKVEESGYQDISSIQDLTLDEMENIISLDISGLSVKVEGVEIKPEEFLGKFGEWNLWLPHTKDTSAKIAGYDENHNPKTNWCTARTKGSNLFYNYIGRNDIPAFLFYIIKDNPKNDKDWLSLGYISHENRLVPDFSGRDGSLSVDRANKGLTERDYSKVLGDSWNSIKSRIESELERYKIVEGGKEKYVSPARSIIKNLAKNLEEFKKELAPKSNEEKKSFIEVIMDSDPSDDVLKVCGNTLARITPRYFLSNLSNKPWAKDYLGLAAENLAMDDPEYFLEYNLEESWAKPDLIDLAAKIMAEKKPEYFLRNFSEKPWAQPYIVLAIESLAEKDPKYFLHNLLGNLPFEGDLDLEDDLDLEAKIMEAKIMEYKDSGHNFSGNLLFEDNSDLAAKIMAYKDPGYLLNLAAENLANKDPRHFLEHYSEKPWAKPHLGLAARNCAEIDPQYFLRYHSEKPWAEPYRKLAAKNLAEINPEYLLIYHSKAPWAENYLKLAAENLARIIPRYFLSNFSNRPWAKDHIELAAKILAEKDPEAILYFLNEPWTEPYIADIAKMVAEKYFKEILNHSYINISYTRIPIKILDGKTIFDLAINIMIDRDPAEFLYEFSDNLWAKPHLDLAAKIMAKKDPGEFLKLYSNETWAEPYIDSAAEIVAENNPELFLKRFSKKPWVKPHHIELAKSKLNNKEASTSIQDKLLKLSNFLKSNNLKEYNYLNYYIRE